jgi:hypothetical protein
LSVGVIVLDKVWDALMRGPEGMMSTTTEALVS